jgi:hypothetical protein
MENIKSYVQENKDRFINELIELLKMLMMQPTLKLLKLRSSKASWKQDVIS